jgi:hypothetical protein
MDTLPIDYSCRSGGTQLGASTYTYSTCTCDHVLCTYTHMHVPAGTRSFSAVDVAGASSLAGHGCSSCQAPGPRPGWQAPRCLPAIDIATYMNYISATNVTGGCGSVRRHAYQLHASTWCTAACRCSDQARAEIRLVTGRNTQLQATRPSISNQAWFVGFSAQSGLVNPPLSW